MSLDMPWSCVCHAYPVDVLENNQIAFYWWHRLLMLYHHQSDLLTFSEDAHDSVNVFV